MNGQATTTEPTSTTTVEAWNNGGWQRWTVTGTCDQILAYIERRNEGLDVLDRQRVNIDPIIFDPQANWPEDIVTTTFPEYGPWTPDMSRLMDYFNPTCEHGMSAILCMGPEHFMSRDQEMAMGW